MIRILTSLDIENALPMAEAIAAMKWAFVSLSEGNVEMPLRSRLDINGHAGTALFMPAHIRGSRYYSVKTVGVYQNNPSRGLPFIQGMICLFDAESGTPLAVMDAAAVTARRTGAASGLATDLFAREDASNVVLFGAGVQAYTQLQAVCEVRPVKEALVHDPDTTKAERFCREMSKRLNMPVRIAGKLHAALQKADVICTATVSRRPVFDDADLPPGMHINAVGSFKPEVQEIPVETVVRAKVVVDHRESALAETGDLIIPIAQGLLREESLHGELGEVAAGRIPARENREEITLFKSVGLAVQDLAAAAVAYERAIGMNLGKDIPLQ